MNLKFILNICLFSCWCSFSNAGGGSVVNNGAGIVEQNFQFAYVSINKISAECIKKESCHLSVGETAILKRISVITYQNLKNIRRIQFVSEKKAPGFFSTGPSEPSRIAKTSLDASSPIYVNSDLLYLNDGSPALNFAAIVAILTHELGHQAGESSHEILDSLGAKLRLIVEEKFQEYKINASNEKKLEVVVTVLSHDTPVKTSELFVTWGQVYARSLTENIRDQIYCSSPFLTAQGFDVQNGHFTFLEDEKEIGFKALLEIYCLSSFTNSIVVEKRDLTFFINKDSNIRNFHVDYWWGF